MIIIFQEIRLKSDFYFRSEFFAFRHFFKRWLISVGSGSFKLLHDWEDECGGNEANHCKDSPKQPYRDLSPENHGNRHKIVADSSCRKPSAHHRTFQLRRSHFRYKRYTHRRKQQLSKCKHKVCRYQPIRGDSTWSPDDRERSAHHDCICGCGEW